MTTGLRHIATEPASLSSHKTFTAMDRKRSPQLRNKMKSVAGTASDSDGSVESNSLSVDSNNDQITKILPSKEPVLKRSNRRGSEWEIVEGLKDGQRFEKKPEVFTGYLQKKRKWPLKGWHKRYFVLDKGILQYGKSPGDVARGKIHGSVDIGLSVISTKSKRMRLDIDAEEFIHHLKVKQYDVFQQWVQQLRQHRLYRQHLLTYGSHATTEESNAANRSKLVLTPSEGVGSRSPPSLPRLAAWLLEANPPLELAARDLSQTQTSLSQLTRLLTQLEASTHPDEMCSGDGFSPNVKKDRRKFGLRKKKSGKGSSVDLNSGCSPNKATIDNESSSPLSTCSFSGGLNISAAGATLSSSNPSLTTVGMPRPQSLPAAEHLFPPLPTPAPTPDNHLHSDFTVLAKEVHSSLKSILYTLNTERERLKSALEAEGGGGAAGGGGLVASLRNTLHQTLQQNADLRARLGRIHENSDLSDLSETVQKPLQQSLSYSSSYSASEFYDAEETHREGVGGEQDGQGEREGGGTAAGASDTSSEAGSLTSEEGSVSSENSELGASEYNQAQTSFVALGTAIQLNSTFPQLGTLTHVVLINAKDNHCAGSLISENTVLTSAHCLVHVKAREVRVQAGVIDVTRADENMQERRGLHIFIHPEYRPGRLAGYDVGLLRVEENFTFNQVVFKVELWDRDWPVTEEPTGMLCQASGWYEDQMRQIKLRMWDMVAHHGEKACPCTKRYQWKRMVCAEPDDQLEELCKSDKGGALICRDKAVGIIHMTRERRTCKNPDYPDCNPEAPRGIQYYQFLCPVNDWLRMYVNHLPPKPISCGASVLRWTLLLTVVMLINYFGAV